MQPVVLRRTLTTSAMIALSAIATIRATPLMAQQVVSRANLTGEWSGPIALDAGTQTLALVFRVADTTLAGTVYSDGDKFGDMESLTLAGNKVHFTLGRLDFTGLIEGTTMKVALIVFNGSTRNLTLKKVPASGGDGPAPRKPPHS
jgi:hypothetical protein